MNSQAKRLDGAAKVLVVVSRKPFFPEVTGNAVVVSDRLVRDDLFTTAPIFCMESSVRNWREGREELRRDLPNLSNDQAAKVTTTLDPRGIIKQGSVVRFGDILVGKVLPINDENMSIEELLLRTIFGREGANGLVDRSLRYYFRDPGVVCGIEILSHSLYSCGSCGDIPGTAAKPPPSVRSALSLWESAEITYLLAMQTA